MDGKRNLSNKNEVKVENITKTSGVSGEEASTDTGGMASETDGNNISTMQWCGSRWKSLLTFCNTHENTLKFLCDQNNQIKTRAVYITMR